MDLDSELLALSYLPVSEALNASTDQKVQAALIKTYFLNQEALNYVVRLCRSDLILILLNYGYNDIVISSDQEIIAVSKALIQTNLKSLKLRAFVLVEIVPLIQALEVNQTLTDLSLNEFFNVNRHQNTSLLRCISDKVNITRLDLSYNNIAIIIDSIPYQNLTYLNLSNGRLSHNDGIGLFRYLSKNISITSLDLSYNFDEYKGSSYYDFYDSLCDFFSSNQTLQILNLFSCKLGAEFTAKNTIQALVKNQGLTHLNLGYANFISSNISGIAYILSHNLRLIYLNLSYIKKDSNGFNDPNIGISRLADNLEHNLNNLQNLNLEEFEAPEEKSFLQLANCLKTNHTLTLLNLNNIRLQFNVLQNLGEALLSNKTLKSLFLSGQFSTLKSIAEALSVNMSLTELDLSLYAGPYKMEALYDLAVGISQNKSLIKLNLDGFLTTNKPVITTQEETFLIGVLIQHSTLIDLNLESNKFEADIALQIIKLLPQIQTPKILRLSGNQFSKDQLTTIQILLEEKDGELIENTNIITLIHRETRDVIIGDKYTSDFTRKSTIGRIY